MFYSTVICLCVLFLNYIYLYNVNDINNMGKSLNEKSNVNEKDKQG